MRQSLQSKDSKPLGPFYIWLDTSLVVQSAPPEIAASGAEGDDALNLGDLASPLLEIEAVTRLAQSGEPTALTIRGEVSPRSLVFTAVPGGFLLLPAPDAAELDAQAARRAVERAETANRTNSAFLAAVSHELREPLVGVIGGVEALKTQALSADQAELAALIEQSGQALTRVVDDVLDFASLGAGALSLKEEAFDLRAELEESVRGFETLTSAAGVAFDTRLAGSLNGVFLGDRGRLRQVVTSLISNAVRFTDRGGVSVSAELIQTSGQTELILEVSDTGRDPGLHPELEPFASGLPETATNGRTFGVAGLGLAIARALVERMGGLLDIEVATGRGAVFRVRAPLKRAGDDTLAAPVAIASAPETETEDQAPVRALVAEDHVVNRRIIELMLAPLGVEVTLVANGAEAVDAFREGGFALVLLDMQMPVLDGVSAARTMRQTESDLGWPRTPIAMLTANVLPRHKAEAMAAGADLFIAKPVTPATLAASLDQLIRAGGTEA